MIIVYIAKVNDNTIIILNVLTNRLCMRNIHGYLPKYRTITVYQPHFRYIKSSEQNSSALLCSTPGWIKFLCPSIFDSSNWHSKTYKTVGMTITRDISSVNLIGYDCTWQPYSNHIKYYPHYHPWRRQRGHWIKLFPFFFSNHIRQQIKGLDLMWRHQHIYQH